jgi:ribosomal protein RSM22 (predicted rRNA methylase)
MDIRWRPYFPRNKGALAKHDICIAAYSLNELNDSVERHHVLNKLIQSSQQYIVLIEPGTPHGFSIIDDSRAYVLKVSRKLGIPFHVVAPCPHDGACPLRGTKSWCHFTQRHTRTEEQRIAVKSLTGKAPRDTFAEKFSYVILKRGFREGRPDLFAIDAPRHDEANHAIAQMEHMRAAQKSDDAEHDARLQHGVEIFKGLSTTNAELKIPHSRILRTRKRKGHVVLDLCTVLDQDGAHLGDNSGTILRQTVSRAKSNKSWDKGSAYRASRTLQQGDQWPLLYQAGSNTIEAPVLLKEYLFPEGVESDSDDDIEQWLRNEGWFIDDDSDDGEEE